MSIKGYTVFPLKFCQNLFEVMNRITRDVYLKRKNLKSKYVLIIIVLDLYSR